MKVVLVSRKVRPKSGIGFCSRLAANLVSTHPYSVQSHVSRAMQDVVRKIEAEQAVDLWHVEWTPYAQNLRQIVRRPWVVMAHNIESQIWQRYAETETNVVKRWYIGRQLRKFVRFERSVFGEAHRSAVVSNEDADLASRWFGVPRPEVVTNGVDVDYFHPASSERQQDTLLFLGSLDWRPNLDAVDLLLSEIFPQVVRLNPAARLSIVGRRPPQWLRRMVAKQPNAMLYADVADVRSFCGTADCSWCHCGLAEDRGSRFSKRWPVDVPWCRRAFGAEGLQLTPGEHFAQAEISEMPEAISRSIANHKQSLAMAERGREQIVNQYSWTLLADRLQAVWNSVVEPGRPIESTPVRSGLSADAAAVAPVVHAGAGGCAQ